MKGFLKLFGVVFMISIFKAMFMFTGLWLGMMITAGIGMVCYLISVAPMGKLKTNE